MSRPATLPPHTTRPEQETGGRGPTPPHYRGYGDDGWKNNPPGRRGPYARLKRFRVGLAVTLISVFILFVALTSAYVVRQGGGRIDDAGNFVRDWKPVIIPAILWLNTALLLLSSLTIELARRA